MRHRNAGRKFGMDSSARKAMFKNMVTSLMVHGHIRTTEQRAKELKRYADRLISVGKRAPLLDGLEGAALDQARADRVAAIRRIKLWVNDDTAVAKLMGEYAEHFRTRPGGYTRMTKLSMRRPGDKAEMAVVELVGAMGARQASPDEEPTVVASKPAGETASLA
jgi:large subunit ribosomal protein L17